MKYIVLPILLALFTLANVQAAEVDLVGEVDVQLEKEYNLDVFNMDVKAELESQTYLFGVDLDLGKNLTLSPRVGIWDSALDVADLVELENSIGFVAGLSGEYKIVELYPGIMLSGIGQYVYADTEVDVIKIKPINIEIENPLRNDLDFQSYEVGAKLTLDLLPISVIPYVAVVYSESTMNLNANLAILNLDIDGEADDNIGLRAGIVGTPIDNLKLKLEGRFIDEKAVLASLAYRF